MTVGGGRSLRNSDQNIEALGFALAIVYQKPACRHRRPCRICRAVRSLKRSVKQAEIIDGVLRELDSGIRRVAQRQGIPWETPSARRGSRSGCPAWTEYASRIWFGQTGVASIRLIHGYACSLDGRPKHMIEGSNHSLCLLHLFPEEWEDAPCGCPLDPDLRTTTQAMPAARGGGCGNRQR